MKKIIPYIIGALIVFLLIAGVRFFTLEENHLHYHTNFALFINEQRIDFSKPNYSEDVADCAVEGQILPRQRVHLHENNPDVVHVHHDGATWGHFLANLGFALGPNSLEDDQGNLYQNSTDKKLSFILNGKVTTNPYNTVIGNEDRLLISYGAENTATLIADQFSQVASNAPEYNAKHDPSGCAGDEHLDFAGKLKKALFF